MRGLGIGLILLSLVYLGLAYPVSAETPGPVFIPASAKPQETAGISLPLNVLREATKLVKAQSPAQAVRDYLRTTDPYSTYISREERRVLDDLDRPDYAGVGMEVIQASSKDLLCVPFDDGPAHKAGVRFGDRLLAVDGERVGGLSLELLSPLVRGPAGKAVVLTVAGADGRERTAKVVRAQIHRQAVESKFDGGVLRIRIYRFENETPDLAAKGLRLGEDYRKVIIDLRGNVGGELKAAVETAALFLPPDSLVASVVRLGGEGQPFWHRVSPTGERYAGRRQIIIWQDQMTASASEVFIAALTHYGFAVTIGAPTFGKGMVQGTFPAPDGGIFIITTGELLTPDGTSFNNRGLPPRIHLRDSYREKDYFARTKEAFAAFSELATGRMNP